MVGLRSRSASPISSAVRLLPLAPLMCTLVTGCATTRRAYVRDAAGRAPAENEGVYVYRPIVRGERVVIHFRDGHTLAGRLLDGDDSTLVVDERPPIPRREIYVVELDRRHNPGVDFLVGAGAGAGVALIYLLASVGAWAD